MALLGTGPNQVSTNADLGTMAFQDARAISVGQLVVTGIAGMGYGFTSGSTVTQLTSKSTGVTINYPTGQITLNNSALAAATSTAFILTNSVLAATDVVLVNIAGGATTLAYGISVEQVSAGSCRIQLRNNSATSLSEAMVLNFVVIKGSNT